jgi:hypothetical protein
LKKSKPYLAVMNLWTENLDKASDAVWIDFARELRNVPFERYRQFMLNNEPALKRFFGGGARGAFLREFIDWLKQRDKKPPPDDSKSV